MNMCSDKDLQLHLTLCHGFAPPNTVANGQFTPVVSSEQQIKLNVAKANNSKLVHRHLHNGGNRHGNSSLKPNTQQQQASSTVSMAPVTLPMPATSVCLLHLRLFNCYHLLAAAK
jgi:hypothetical protein